MMWLIVLGAMLVVFSTIGIAWRNNYDAKGDISIVCTALAIFTLIAFMAVGVVAIVCNVSIEGRIAADEQIYKSLTYQLENDVYDNELDISKRELYDAVTEWNKNLARGRALQDDPWIGIFYPDIYDQFEFIELP